MKAFRRPGLLLLAWLWVTAAVVGWWGLLASGWRHMQDERRQTAPYVLWALGAPLLFAGVAWLHGWSLRLVRRGPPRLWLKSLIPLLLASAIPLTHLSIAIPHGVSNTENPPSYLLAALLVALPALGLAAAGWWSGRAGLYQAAIAVWGVVSSGLGVLIAVLLFREPRAEGWGALGTAVAFLLGVSLMASGLLAALAFWAAVKMEGIGAAVTSAEARRRVPRWITHAAVVAYVLVVGLTAFRCIEVVHGKSLSVGSRGCLAPSQWRAFTVSTFSSSGVEKVHRVLLIPPDTPHGAHRVWRHLGGTVDISLAVGPEWGQSRTIHLPPSHEVYQLRGEEVIAADFEVTAEQALAFIDSSQADHSLESLRRHLAAKP